jgi:hypothetical protein
MSQFRNWYVRNQDAITWFLIGWLAYAGIDNLGQGKYVWGAIDLGLAFINYKLNSVRLT